MRDAVNGVIEKDKRVIPDLIRDNIIRKALFIKIGKMVGGVAKRRLDVRPGYDRISNYFVLESLGQPGGINRKRPLVFTGSVASI